MSDAGDRQEKRISKLQILVTDTELADIDDWRFENRASNRSAAVRALIQLGMHLCNTDKEEAQKIIDKLDDV